MATHPISPELVRFIARCIHSVEQLEVLCLVDSNRDRVWTVPEVLHVIQSSADSVSYCLRTFQRYGFLVSSEPGKFRVAAATKEIGLIRELAETYRERRVAIVELIYKRPVDPIRDFAEAFRLRKDK